MSKKFSDSDVLPPNMSWGYAYVLNEEAPNYLIGKIMPIIEIMGLPEKQETAIKDQIKQIVRQEFYEGVYIKPERHNKIREDWLVMKNNTTSIAPMSAI